MNKLLLTVLWLVLMLSLVYPSENIASDIDILKCDKTKLELDFLFSEIMENASSLFLYGDFTPTISWLCSFYTMKQYMTRHPILLMASLDELIHSYLVQVFGRSLPFKQDILLALIESKFQADTELLKKMKIRAKLTQMSCVKSNNRVRSLLGEVWLFTLLDIQDRLVTGISERLTLGPLVESNACCELNEDLEVLKKFSKFYCQYTNEPVYSTEALKDIISVLSDFDDLLTWDRKGFEGFLESQHRPGSYLPAFYFYYQAPQVFEKPSIAHYDLFLAVRKHLALYIACSIDNESYLSEGFAEKITKAYPSIAAKPSLPFRLDSKEKAIDMISKAFSAVKDNLPAPAAPNPFSDENVNLFDLTGLTKMICAVFPTIEAKLERIKSILEREKVKLCMKKPFLNPKWNDKAIINALISSSVSYFAHEPSSIKCVYSILNCTVCALMFLEDVKSVRYIRASSPTEATLVNRSRITLNGAVLKKIETSLYEDFSVHADYEHWGPILLEISVLCNQALSQYIEMSNDSITFDNHVNHNLFRDVFGMVSTGALRNTVREALFAKVDAVFAKQHGSTTKIAPPVIKEEDEIVAIMESIEGPKPAVQPQENIPGPVECETFKPDSSFDSDETEESEDDNDVGEEYKEDGVDSIEEKEVKVGNDGKEKSTQESGHEASFPIHIKSLIDHEDAWMLSKFDCRDLAYSYLLIGNEVYNRFIAPFIRYLESYEVRLNSVFLSSLADFEAEVKILEMLQPELLEEAFEENGIDGMEFFIQCLKFYGKRLRVAHQYAPSGSASRILFAKLHLSTLNQSRHSFYGPGSELVDDNAKNFGMQSTSDLFLMKPFTTKMRSGFASEDDINYELSILGLATLFRTTAEAINSGGRGKVEIKDMRDSIAHQRPSRTLLCCIVNGIFINTSHHEVLRKILL